MWTLRINEAASGADGVARLIANRIASRIHWDIRAFVQIAALLPLDARDENLRRKHDCVRLRLDCDGFWLRDHGFFVELARRGLLCQRVDFGTFRAFRCERSERADLVAQFHHHHRLGGEAREAGLNTLVLDVALEEWRKLPDRPQSLLGVCHHRLVLLLQLLLLAGCRLDLSNVSRITSSVSGTEVESPFEKTSRSGKDETKSVSARQDIHPH